MADLTNAQDLFYRTFRCPNCGGERVQNSSGSRPRHPLLGQKPCHCAANSTAASGVDAPDGSKT
jgi:predicted RNA-binding Zn-ribbon protein involved in translation (DUF1610 family)